MSLNKNLAGWITFLSGIIAFISYTLVAAAVNFNLEFFYMYKHVIEGTCAHDDLANAFACMGLQILGILWFVFALKDYRKQNRSTNV
jgi:hypothetical protein